MHRDISENNIVLGLRPEDERGYLIDFDMAMLQDAEEPTPLAPVAPRVPSRRRARAEKMSSFPATAHNKTSKPMKGLRTASTPIVYCRYRLTRTPGHFSLHVLQCPLGRQAYAPR